MFAKPVVVIDEFITFLEKQLNRSGASAELAAVWKDDTRAKVVEGIQRLCESGKLRYTDEQTASQVLLPNFHKDNVQRLYLSMDSSPEKPFPCEMQLAAKIPADEIRRIDVEGALLAFLESEDKPLEPVIISLVFPSNYGQAIILSSFIPERILELALLKLKAAFRTDKSLDYYITKTASRFHGKEFVVKEAFNLLASNTLETMNRIVESSDFNYAFWGYLCQILRAAIQEKANNYVDSADAEQTMYQVAAIINVCNNYYHILALNEKKKDTTLIQVLGHILEPPYMYTMHDIMRFKDHHGSEILNSYAESEVEVYLKKKMVAPDDTTIPEILKYHINEINKDVYIHKSRVFQLCAKLLKELRGSIRDEIITRWGATIREFANEPSMKNKSDFETLVTELVHKHSSALPSIVGDNKTALLHIEAQGSLASANKADMIFEDGKPLPFQEMFALNRNEILNASKMSVPSIYSNAFVIFVMRLLKRKPATEKKHKKDKKNKGVKEILETGKTVATTAQNIANPAAEKIVSEAARGTDVESALDKLADKWNQKINKQAKLKLRKDVDAIIRDSVRYTLKIQQKSQVTSKTINDLAASMLYSQAALKEIADKASLENYIKVFIANSIVSGKY
jgi:hypothetical protein